MGLRLFVGECFPPMNAGGNILIMQDQRYDISPKNFFYVYEKLVILLAFYSAIVVVDSFISTAQNGVCLSLKSLSAGTKEKLTES